MKNILVLLTIVTLGMQCSKKINYKNSIVVEKMYATTTAMGGLDYSVQNVFGSGKWRSMPSTLPLDGVMLYIASPEGIDMPGIVKLGASITSMQIDCPSSSASKELEVFINGSVLNRDGISCDSRFTVGTTVSSIYVRAFNMKKSKEPVHMEISQIIFFRKKKEAEIKLNVIYPEIIEGSVSASSVLDPNSYRPQFLFDGNSGFGWVEGKKDAGIGESVNFKFDSSVKLTGMEIYTGYQRSASHFKKNAAPISLTFTNTKNTTEKISLQNSMGAQRVFFDSTVAGKNFRLKIEKVRRGSKWQDSVISEIVFLGESGRRIVLYDPKSESIKKNLISKVNSGLLKNFVGESFIGTDCNSGEYKMELSLRSNGRFVAWRKNSSTKESYVMDGNWQLKSNSGDKAHVTIFGKMHAITSIDVKEEENGPYGETSTYTVSRESNKNYIFSDNLQILPGSDETMQSVCSGDSKFYITSARLNGGFK